MTKTKAATTAAPAKKSASKAAKTPKAEKAIETTEAIDAKVVTPSAEATPKANTGKSKPAQSKVTAEGESPLTTASVSIIRDGVVITREERVRHVAYLRAEARGFEPGHEVEDWLAAEAEVDGKPQPKADK